MKKSSVVSRSGRFAEGPAAEVAQFTQAVSCAWRLWRQDIQGSIAHSKMLRKIGILSAAELRDILKGLQSIGAEIQRGRFRWKPELEDVHMNIEAELTRRFPAGAKLHTGRSRNDQVAVDLRLWVRDEISAMFGELADLLQALMAFAERESDTLIPGYTHLPRAQPVFLAHHLLAYV